MTLVLRLTESLLMKTPGVDSSKSSFIFSPQLFSGQKKKKPFCKTLTYFLLVAVSAVGLKFGL